MHHCTWYVLLYAINVHLCTVVCVFTPFQIDAALLFYYIFFMGKFVFINDAVNY